MAGGSPMALPTYLGRYRCVERGVSTVMQFKGSRHLQAQQLSSCVCDVTSRSISRKPSDDFHCSGFASTAAVRSHLAPNVQKGLPLTRNKKKSGLGRDVVGPHNESSAETYLFGRGPHYAAPFF